jgi:hypothetical protein
MKKIFLIFVLGPFLLGASCKNISTSVLENTSTTVTSTKNNINSEGRYVDYGYVQKSLSDNKQIKEIKLTRSFALPSTDIQIPQLKKYFQLGTGTFVGYFALFQTKSSNTSFDLPDTAKRAGILFAKNDDKQWQVLFEIQNASNQSRNNPFYLWNEGSKIFLLVSDDSGAGSGEGVGKIIVSENGGKNWKIDRCFYFIPDHFFEQQRKLGFNFLPWLKKNLYTGFDKGGIIGNGYEYTYNNQTRSYESEQFNKVTGKNEIINEKDCKNIVLE